MQHYTLRYRSTAFAALVSALILSTSWTAHAAEPDRAGRGEFYVAGFHMDGNAVDATSGGTRVEIEPKIWGGGIGVAYNFNHHLNLNAEFGVGATEVEGRALGQTVTLEPTAYSATVGLDYNILKTRLTPVASVSGGVIGYEGDGVSEANWIVSPGAGPPLGHLRPRLRQTDVSRQLLHS